MKHRIKSKVLAVAAALTAVGVIAAGGTLIATQASASSLSCTQTKTSFTTPYGCGGLEFQYQVKGILDMAADGNYWNAAVRVQGESLTSTAEDFSVFADTINSPVTTGGEGDLGEYIAMFTPNGVIPGGCGPAGTPCTAANNVVASSPLDFCVSVQNIIRTVRGHQVERWVVVLRNCFSGTGEGSPGFTLGTGTNPNTVSNPNLYQTWAPAIATTASPSPVALVNEALLYASYRHGFGGNDRYVLDDAAFGGAGTQLLAYPANGGLNQDEDAIGCTPPLTGISGLAQVCP